MAIAQVQDRVSNQLPGAVVGYVTATIGLNDFSIGWASGKQVALVGVLAQGVNRLVLQKETMSGSPPLSAWRGVVLKLPDWPVGLTAKVENRQWWALGFCWINSAT